MPTSNCTITVLPDVLTFIHIPRSRLKQFSHYLVKQILTPAPSFLNITCNKTDLLLFTHYSALQDFEPFAIRERQRHRKPSRVNSSTGTRRSSIAASDSIKVSYDVWNVLQLDSHNDRLDNAGTRIRELSATLAEAGISIMYQSSYTSDFIFVKSSRLPQVLARLAQAGFVGYSFDNISPPLNNGLSFVPLEEKLSDTASSGLVLEHNPNIMGSCSSGSVEITTSLSSRKFSGSESTFSEVEILDQDLICVGLPESFTDTWSLKIIKLVAYPELILSHSASDLVHSADLYDDTSTPSSSLADGRCTGRPSAEVSRSIQDFWIYSPLALPSPSNEQSSLISENEGVLVTTCSHPTPKRRSSPLQYSRSLPETHSFGKHPSQHTRINSLEKLKSITTRGGLTPSFFSFTRTAEGSSLTASQKHIAALFPSNERHMVICGDEIDSEYGNDDVDFFNSGSPEGLAIMKCLQLDLQRFGGDRHGIISNCSKILDSNGINHMYSSTYQTANLLVNRVDARRAAALLQLQPF